VTLRVVNPETRRRLRWHAWLLAIGCVASIWVLLQVLHVRLSSARHGIAAIVVALVAALRVTGVVSTPFSGGVIGLRAEGPAQFVLGAPITRRLIGPKGPCAVFMAFVGPTWLAGLGGVSTADRRFLERRKLAGATMADLFR
jgi:uncharacterized membrane protein